jgi:hypothetical protein
MALINLQRSRQHTRVVVLEEHMAFDGMVWEPARLRWHGLTFSLDPGDPGTTELVLWKTAAV